MRSRAKYGIRDKIQAFTLGIMCDRGVGRMCDASFHLGNHATLRNDSRNKGGGGNIEGWIPDLAWCERSMSGRAERMFGKRHASRCLEL